jgi:hypothetical protein
MSPTVFHQPQSSCLGGDPHNHWCDGCGNYVTGPDCEVCADREARSGMGLVAGLALAAAVIMLAIVVAGVAYLVAGKP